jgi:hypothetical protein
MKRLLLLTFCFLGVIYASEDTSTIKMQRLSVKEQADFELADKLVESAKKVHAAMLQGIISEHFPEFHDEGDKVCDDSTCISDIDIQGNVLLLTVDPKKKAPNRSTEEEKPPVAQPVNKFPCSRGGTVGCITNSNMVMGRY